MSKILSRREIDELLRIIECHSDRKGRRLMFFFTLRTRLRRFLCLLLRREENTFPEDLLHSLTAPEESGPARIYPCRVK